MNLEEWNGEEGRRRERESWDDGGVLSQFKTSVTIVMPFSALPSFS
jgi:hypothetical protein